MLKSTIRNRNIIDPFVRKKTCICISVDIFIEKIFQTASFLQVYVQVSIENTSFSKNQKQ